MPTYDYLCKTCGKKFEYFQSIKADKLEFCLAELCEQEAKGSGSVERMIGSGAGVIFTGSGFYETDYVRNSGKKTEKNNNTSNGSSNGGESGTAGKTNESAKTAGTSAAD